MAKIKEVEKKDTNKEEDDVFEILKKKFNDYFKPTYFVFENDGGTV